MGYLVRRPNTHLYRLALMPFTIWVVLRASFGYVWVNEEFSPYNFGQGELEDADFIVACGRCSWLEAFIGSPVSSYTIVVSPMHAMTDVSPSRSLRHRKCG